MNKKVSDRPRYILECEKYPFYKWIMILLIRRKKRREEKTRKRKERKK